MDWAIFAVAVAMATLVIGVLSYRRMSPKRQLDWWLVSTQLVESASQKHMKDLEIKAVGVVVRDPYMNTLTIYSNSRADIASNDFDSGKPIVIEVTKGGAVELQDGSSTRGIEIGGGSGEGMERAKFEIAPQLIRKRSKATLAFVSSGPSSVEIRSSLVDIKVRRVPVTDKFVIPSSVRSPKWVTLVLLLGIVTFASIFSFIISLLK